jgi:hypothetical protein
MRPLWGCAASVSESSRLFGDLVGRLALLRELRWVRRATRSVIVHDSRWVRGLPPWLVVPQLCRPVKGKLTRPPNLTIVVAHNHGRETVMERSLRYVGIRDYAVARVPAALPWKNTRKIIAVLDLLRSAPEPTEFALFCDADDCVIRDDPRKAVALLERNDCELLFSNTYANKTYRYMPEVAAWVERTAPAEAVGGRYLNSGVYVGRWDTIIEVLSAASEYVITDHDHGVPTPVVRRKDGSVQVTDRFPHGIDNDQTIMRYLQRRFHPRVKVDFEFRLALRGPPLNAR